MLENIKFLTILQQAVSSTSEGITIADVNYPDMPLVYVNNAFCDISGYNHGEVLGKNCRYLQGERTEKNSVLLIRESINKRENCVVELINYRKNGELFINRLSMVPVGNAVGEITHFVGIQSDITRMKQADRERAQLRAMHTTMNTVNDIVFNFMSNLDYFKMEIEEKLGEDKKLLETFNSMFENTHKKLKHLNSLTQYKEKRNGAKSMIDTGKSS